MATSSRLTGNRQRAVTGGHGRGPRGQMAALPAGTSQCPVAGCPGQISLSRLMCRRHWYWVPKQTRDLVWATWRSGHGAFSSEHQAAVRQAIAEAAPGREAPLFREVAAEYVPG